MPRQRTRVEPLLMPVAGFATNAKGPGRTQIFFDDDNNAFPDTRLIPHRPSALPTNISSLLAMLPAVTGSSDLDASPAGRKHIKPRQSHDFGQLLQHHEYESLKGKADEDSKYVGKRARSRKHTNGAAAQLTSAEIGRHARGGRGKPHGLSTKVTSREAAMMLPPIHGRPQLYNGSPAHQHPDWSVTIDRKPFRPI